MQIERKIFDDTIILISRTRRLRLTLNTVDDSENKSLDVVRHIHSYIYTYNESFSTKSYTKNWIRKIPSPFQLVHFKLIYRLTAF